MASSELVWQLIRGNNSFLKKGLNNTFFSAEPGNLTSKHSYKFSGIANSANVDLTTDKDNAISYAEFSGMVRNQLLLTPQDIPEPQLKAVWVALGAKRPPER